MWCFGWGGFYRRLLWSGSRSCWNAPASQFVLSHNTGPITGTIMWRSRGDFCVCARRFCLHVVRLQTRGESFADSGMQHNDRTQEGDEGGRVDDDEHDFEYLRVVFWILRVVLHHSEPDKQREHELQRCEKRQPIINNIFERLLRIEPRLCVRMDMCSQGWGGGGRGHLFICG